MRILVLSQYFSPETGAAQNRLSDLARRLASAGHQVSVLTSMPNYPEGRIFKGYRGRLCSRQTKDGFSILRIWCYVSKRRDFMSRLLNYCSFAAFALLAGIIAFGKQDVIVVESPPLFLGMTGVALSRLRGSQMILNVSDLWPQSAISMGILRNAAAIRIAFELEAYIYDRSDAITGQTEGIIDYVRRFTTAIPVELITNGVDPERFSAGTQWRDEIRHQLGFGNNFVVGYAGLHGLAQGLQTVLDAAELLGRNSNPVLFALFGDGPEKRGLEAVAAARGLRNVLFFPPQPSEQMPRVLASLDAAIVPLKNLPLFAGALPSKLFECMAAGLPILLSAPRGEATNLVQRAKAGICVQPEDPVALAEAIKQLNMDPAFCESAGQNARQYVGAHYDRAELARRFMRLLGSIHRDDLKHNIGASAATSMQEQNLEL